MIETKRLIRDHIGYRVERSENWKGYNPSNNGQQLAHDIMHHRFDETGSAWEELRALGGAIQMMPTDFASFHIFLRDAAQNGWTRPQIVQRTVHPEIESRFVGQGLDWCGMNEQEALFVLSDGYRNMENNWKHKREVFFKIARYAFNPLFHDTEGDLIVNLTTGVITLANDPNKSLDKFKKQWYYSFV